MDEEKQKPSSPRKSEKFIKIKPLKDHVICHNEYYIEIKKGESCEVPALFKDNLKTEKVIK